MICEHCRQILTLSGRMTVSFTSYVDYRTIMEFTTEPLLSKRGQSWVEMRGGMDNRMYTYS